MTTEASPWRCRCALKADRRSLDPGALRTPSAMKLESCPGLLEEATAGGCGCGCRPADGLITSAVCRTGWGSCCATRRRVSVRLESSVSAVRD
eukprot:2347618-Prymnesium_polylepis.2